MRFSRIGSVAAILLLALSFVAAFSVPLQTAAYSSPLFDCGSASIFGTGATGNVTISSNTVLSTDANYGNLTINSGVNLDPNGHTIRICGTLTILGSGTIRHVGSSGSTGSTGGSGTSGGFSSVASSCSYAGQGASGSPGSSSGGSGAWECGSSGQTMSGGPGTGGGKGQTGGTGSAGSAPSAMTIYVWVINNANLISDEGGTGGGGGTGGPGGPGGNQNFYCSGGDCAAGGGGGGNAGNGGTGGRGGPGGTVTLYYGSTYGSGIGTITAPGGSGGSGGVPGSPGSGGAGESDGTGCGTTRAGGAGNGGGDGGGVTWDSNLDCLGSGGSSGFSGSYGSSGSSGSVGSVTVQKVVLVTLPILLSTPTGLSAFTYTVSGGSVSPTSATSGSSATDFTFVNGSTITITMPGPSSSTRPIFASNSTTTSEYIACSSPTCSTWEPTDYAQIQRTYIMNVSSGTWDASYTEPVTGTLSGSSGVLLCDVSITSGSSSGSRPCWGDRDKTVTAPSTISAAGSQAGTWTAATYTFTDTTGGGTDTATYTFNAVAQEATNSFGIREIAYSAATTSGVCSIDLSNTVQGDLMVLTWGGVLASSSVPPRVSDSLTLGWIVAGSAGSSVDAAYEWYAYVTSAAAIENITIYNLAHGTNSGGCGAYEMLGMPAFTPVIKTATGSGSGLSTSSQSFSSSRYIAIVAAQYSVAVTWTAGSSFTSISGSTSAAGGSEYSTSVSSPTTFPMTSSSGSYTWAEVGAVFAYGVSGANLYLQDSATGLPFAIGGYAGSSAEVDYAGSTPPTYYKLNMSQTIVSLYGATLVKVWVGTSYFASVIPAAEPDAANITIYLTPPATAYAYNLQINDLSGLYGPGTEAIISNGGRVYSSGYTDASDAYAFYLAPGTYPLKLVHDSNTYSTSVSLPGLSGTTVSVNIFSYSKKSSCGSFCTNGYGGYFTGGGNYIVVNYNDSLSSTTSIAVDLYRQNGSLGSPFLLYSNTQTGRWGVFSLNFSCSGCSSYGSQLYVALKYTDSNGQNAVSFGIGGGSFAGIHVPTWPTALWGWVVAFPTVNPTDVIALIIMVLSAASMGAADARAGAMVLGIEAVGLSAIGWFPAASVSLLTFLVALSVLAFIAYLAEGR